LSNDRRESTAADVKAAQSISVAAMVLRTVGDLAALASPV
jgi:hypothetical protein